MALEIWFKEDIANAVKAAHEAGVSALILFEQMTDNAELVYVYQQGYQSALRAVATTFGIDLEESNLNKDFMIPTEHLVKERLAKE